MWAVKIGIDWRNGVKDTLSCALEFPILFNRAGKNIK
jgi:hypothetical protein